jgi:N-acetylglucosamine kinase
VVLAGTGSFVHGLTRDGRTIHLDSLGPLIGDYGSGYHIGYMALRAAARSKWRPGYSTSLSDILRTACGADIYDYTGAGLIPFAGRNPDRAEIAAFARIVNEEANSGDGIAIGIMKEAAEAISETTRDVVDSLGIAEDRYSMIGIGGVAANSAIYWDHLSTLVKEFAPNLEPIQLRLPAVIGVALAILRKFRTGEEESLRETIFRSYQRRRAKYSSSAL